MTDLSHKFIGPRAEFKKLLLVAGAHGWTREQALSHLHDELANQPWREMSSRYLPSFLVGFFGLEPFDHWRTNMVYALSRRSHTPCEPYYLRGTRRRHAITQELPAEARAMMKSVLSLAPATSFQVSFIGEDPVLWAIPEGHGHTYHDIAPSAEPIMVWVGHGPRPTILMPPR